MRSNCGLVRLSHNTPVLVFSGLLLSISSTVMAQQNVGIGTLTPDSSAVLDVSSADRGLLIPRMSAATRQAIVNPAVGLMVYDSTNNAFYYFTGAGWLEMLAGNVYVLSDADGDTKIQVEESPDEDRIRFDLGGTEGMILQKTGLGKTQIVFPNNNENVAIGSGAGASFDEASHNVAIGHMALKQDTVGESNVAIGRESLRDNVTGGVNVALGGYSLWKNQSGSQNIAIGEFAFANNRTGHHNILLGECAGCSTFNGNDNVLIGSGAGAGSNSSDKSNNVMIGANSGGLNNGSNNVFLGYQAGLSATGSNKLYIENSSSSSPLIYGEFGNDLLRINGTLNINNAFSFPVTDGMAGQILQTNGAGIVSWGNKTLDTDDQVLSLNGDSLSISEGNTIDLSSIDTDTDDQVLSLNGDSLSISEGNTIDLSSIDTDTDDQVLSLNGDSLSISEGNTIDLSSINKVQSLISDDDNDTWIEAQNDNTIHISTGGTEYVHMQDGRIDILNTGHSVFLGRDAGFNDEQDDNENVFVGDSSGTANTSGFYNVAVGSKAMKENRYGTINTAVGRAALQKNFDGNANTSIGYSSLYENVTGSQNTAIGVAAISSNQSGHDNTATGFTALQFNTSGSNNAAYGSFALFNNDSGNGNVAIGDSTGFSNVTGNASVFIGHNAGYHETNSDRLYIESAPFDSADNQSPLIYGEFDNDLLRINGTLNINNNFSFPSTDGTPGQALVTDGSGNVSWMDQTDTDDQAIDILNLNGDTLEISLENDGMPVHKLDLSSINSVQTVIADADGNTKIQVEESPDENKIRFDIGGTEYFVVDSGRIHVVNTGNSIFIGENAGQHDDFDNRRNIGIGPFALRDNVLGRWNTATGYAAMRRDTVGSGNTAYGFGVLDPNNGNDNTGVGFLALAQSLNAHRNVAIGANAGRNIQGSGNVCIGFNAGVNESGSNKLYISNTDSISLIYGEFDNNWLKVNGRLTPSLGITDVDGDTKIQVEESADDDVIRFDIAGQQRMYLDSIMNVDTRTQMSRTGRNALTLRTPDNAQDAGLAFRNSGGSYTWSLFRTDAGSNLADLVIAGGTLVGDPVNAVERLRITSAGNVGIGTDTVDYKLQVGNAGDGTEARANAWNTFSDRRWKTDLSVITNAIEKIEAMHGYYYTWIDRPDTTLQVGVIAQEIEAVLPEVVSTDTRGYKSVDYSKLTALLIEGVKQQQQQIDRLTNNQQELSDKLDALNALLEKQTTEISHGK